jgi:hypothetical protein
VIHHLQLRDCPRQCLPSTLAKELCLANPCDGGSAVREGQEWKRGGGRRRIFGEQRGKSIDARVGQFVMVKTLNKFQTLASKWTTAALSLEGSGDARGRFVVGHRQRTRPYVAQQRNGFELHCTVGARVIFWYATTNLPIWTDLQHRAFPIRRNW